MDFDDDGPAINAAFARLAIDDGTDQILIESRCNRCGCRMVGLPLTISREESMHLAACIKAKSRNLQASA